MYAHSAIMENHGQNCCAGSRTYVHEYIYDEFVAKAKTAGESRVVGDPFNPDTAQGPLVSFTTFNTKMFENATKNDYSPICLNSKGYVQLEISSFM